MEDVIRERIGPAVVGVSNMDSLEFEVGTKEISRIPVCGNGSPRKRETVTSAWVWENKHEFGKPNLDVWDCTLCRAEYAENYRKGAKYDHYRVAGGVHGESCHGLGNRIALDEIMVLRRLGW